MRIFLALLLLACGAQAAAAELLGRVVRVVDGDTVTVLDADKAQYVVRLAGIDAPERGQPFGQVSRRHLADMVHTCRSDGQAIKRARIPV
jgi:endonuclease YncB( thermonuclease family)